MFRPPASLSEFLLPQNTLDTGIAVWPKNKRRQSESAFEQPASLDTAIQIRRSDARRKRQRVCIQHVQHAASAGALLLNRTNKVPGHR